MTPNIQVEITDASEFHCFRVLLNPKGHDVGCPASVVPGATCVCLAEGAGARLEIMMHARSLVELIHECSVALCEWQKQTTTKLILEKTGLSEAEARKAGLIA